MYVFDFTYRCTIQSLYILIYTKLTYHFKVSPTRPFVLQIALRAEEMRKARGFTQIKHSGSNSLV